MVHALTVRWRGTDYPSLSWALPEMLQRYGVGISDGELSRLTGYAPQRIRAARLRAGIPEHRRRGTTYETLPEELWRAGAGRRV